MDTKRTLVLVDGAGASEAFAEAIAARCEPDEEVFVVGPHRDRARVARSLSGLASHGIFAWGRTGPSDPLAAVADALHAFAADEIVVVAAPSELHRLGTSAARRLFREFGLPVAHIRLDPAVAAPTARPAAGVAA